MAQKAKKKRPQNDQNVVGVPDLGKIVHELNNALYAMGGFVDLAIDDLPEGHPARESLLAAGRASVSAAALVAKLVPTRSNNEGYRKKSSDPEAMQKPRAVSAKRVLVIEEAPLVAELLERALKRFGFAPRVFTDADNALQLFRSTPGEFDAIVADETSLNAIGLEVVVKLQEASPLTPIILMTSGREATLNSSAVGAGTQHVMLKPVTIQDLCRTLEELTLTIVDSTKELG